MECIVHATGRLSFTTATTKALNLERGKHFKFAQDDEDETQLYMLFVRDRDENTFQVRKSGEYFYLPTQALFDSLGYELNNKRTYIFELIRKQDIDDEVGAIVYKMKAKEKSPKGKMQTDNIQ